jgi:hypothetical protein
MERWNLIRHQQIGDTLLSFLIPREKANLTEGGIKS